MLRALGIAISLPWLIDAGVRLVLARCSRAWRPASLEDAAPSLRWLLGQLAILARQPRAIIRLLLARPLEELAFVAGLLSRPLSLTAIFRLTLALAFLFDGLRRPDGALSLVESGLLTASLFSDFLLLQCATDAPFSRQAAAGLRMLASWCGAILLLPRAVLGWLGGRKS